MRKHTALRAISVLLVVVTTLSFMVACGNKNGENNEDNGKNDDPYDLSAFTVVRGDASSDVVADSAAYLKQMLEKRAGVSIGVALDGDSEQVKEILVGETDRAESAEALDYLKGSTDKDAYVVRVTDSKIVLLGKTDRSTARAVRVFLDTYLKVSDGGASVDLSRGTQLAGIYDPDKIISASNGTELEIEISSDVFDNGKGSLNMTLIPGEQLILDNAHYPSVIQLAHQPKAEDNGKLIAIFQMQYQGHNSQATVMVSENDGKSWKFLARPSEKFDVSLSAGQMGHIYELPVQIGDMPAGTLLYSANSCNYSRKSTLAIWRSFDCGKTWDQYALLDEAGGLEEGIWEPFITYCEEDGWLYCFYSDDSDPDHDQKLVYKRTRDGVSWEDKVEVVAHNDFKYRAGMPVITKMGNGEYFLVYEVVTTGAPIYYKKSKSISDFGNTGELGVLLKSADGKQSTSAPACAWLPVGGECGTLVVTGKSSSNKGYLFLSFDYGETWETVKDPLACEPLKASGDRICYSAGLWVGEDEKSLYYVSAVKNEHDRQKISFVKLRIY